MGKVKVIIEYTDGEAVEKEFECLCRVLDFIKASVIDQEEFANKITITSIE